jgi:hypothetical protein
VLHFLQSGAELPLTWTATTRRRIINRIDEMTKIKMESSLS